MLNRRAVILLVEDSDDDADLTVRALRRNNVVNEVVRVADGVEALDYLAATGPYADRDRSDLPELILLDLKLPRLSGLDVLEELGQNGISTQVPIVVLTSSIEERDLERAYALGANSYVQKPVDFEQFTQAVSTIGMYWLLVNESPHAMPTGR
ncbi:MAG TPA: response regulator [Acidimicrobiales bacterium]|nr:response regulator [Acidimicrobiales bacterium]